MRRFIVGTDWWTDCDDAVAMRVLARAHKRGEIVIAGISIDSCMEYSVTSVDGFLSAHGILDIPIGVDLDSTDYGGRAPYQQRLSAYASRFKSNEDAEDALRLYRRILAESKEKVEIIEVGFLQVLAALLLSEGDDISPMSGIELVREKVEKFWIMAGRWDVDGGKENNFARTWRACRGANIFCEKCPVPVTFLGFEVGVNVLTGDNLKPGDVLYDVLQDHRAYNGRDSWDPMLALLAIIGDEEKAGYRVVRGRATVEAETGCNHFTECEDGIHAYVVKIREDDFYKNAINELIAN